MESKEKKFLNIMQAAELLRIHTSTLHGWIRRDKDIKKNNLAVPENFKCPPYGRIGNRYRFLKEDIEKFINDSMKN